MSLVKGQIAWGRERTGFRGFPHQNARLDWVVLEDRRDGSFLGVRGAFNGVRLLSTKEGYEAWCRGQAGGYYLAIVQKTVEAVR